MSDQNKKLEKQNGRPKLSPDQLRTFQINLSLSKVENDFIEQQAKKANLIPSIYCRQSILKSEVKIISPEFFEELKKFNRFGVNINQLVLQMRLERLEPRHASFELEDLLKEYKNKIKIFTGSI